VRDFDLWEEQMMRVEELADNIVKAASQYQLIREFEVIKDSPVEDDVIYKNFILSVLATFDDPSGYEH
jgi:hypothetical protein